MINIKKDRYEAVLYTCGTCNLNCRYCNIDKSEALVAIDKKLEESFKGDYYFNRIKQYFPRKDQLRGIQTWGGEPFLQMQRIYPLVHQLIEYYPYFDTLFSSTNFSYDGWLDKFMGLMDCLAQYPYRKFKYNLQLSVDGPPDINDNNRGKGVSERCIKNFNKLIDLIKSGGFPENVVLEFQIKGTLDLDVIRQLDTKEKIINYYKFFEETYIDPVISLNNPNIITGTSVPNTAVPAPTTKEDGKRFAQLVKNCREIEQENFKNQIFKYYLVITPYCPHAYDEIGLRSRGGGCGTGMGMIGFLPDNLVSICHEGFVQLAEEYKAHFAQRDDKNLTINIDKFIKDHPIRMCMTDEEYVEHEHNMEHLNDSRSSARIASSVNMIIALAMAGQIDECYLEEYNALVAACYIRSNCALCIKNNYSQCGSWFLEPTDLYKLLLNGALQYLIGGQVNECECGQGCV